MRKFVLSTISLILFWNSNAQKVTWDDIPFKTYGEILLRYDSLINPKVYPNLHPEDNGLVYRVYSTNIIYSVNDSEQKRIKQYVDSVESKYIRENKITDNNEIKDLCAITIDGEIYHLRLHQTIKRYLFMEGAGVRYYFSIDEKPGFRWDKILCIFKDNIKYPESDFSTVKISPPNNQDFITPNKKITFTSNNSTYEFNYVADLSKGGFQYKGLGTILPVYFNLRLNLIDRKTGNTNVLLQIPHDQMYKLKDIQIGDINKDSIDDIILQVVDETCTRRLIYISENNNLNSTLKFIGHMIVECDHP